MDSRYEFNNMVGYYWETKGDIEQFIGFSRERAEKFCPHVLKAWDAYEDARRRLDLEINAIKSGG